MPKIRLEDYDEDDVASRPRGHKPRQKVKPEVTEQAVATLAEEGYGDEVGWRFSYQASRYERTWLLSSLTSFYQQHWIADVQAIVKGGKEASVYECLTPDGRLAAAKVYRPRKFRQLRKDHLYRQGRDDLDEDGRLITDDGAKHAIHRKSNFGLELLHTSWLQYEYKTLQTLQAAGADVPAPFASAGNAILMEYVGDPGAPAHSLVEVALSGREARALFKRVVANIDLLLEHRLVHADLSAFNILYWQGAIKLIDFPQAVNPLVNPRAYEIFRRDVRRVCEYFERYGIDTRPAALATELWTKHRYPVEEEVAS